MFPNTQKILTWLQEEVGLYFDPFQQLDAGSDPYISSYLVAHEAFQILWQEHPVLLFAPPGGGKSAFRVRLAANCRKEVEGKRIFPITLLLPPPETLPDEERYFELLARSAAGELLFYLAYRSDRFLRLERSLQRDLKTILTENLPAPLEYYLDQLEEAGNLSPLAEAFDPTARGLPEEPSPETLREFCRTMRRRRRKRRPLPTPEERFNQIVAILRERLSFEAVFILIDGADAYVSRPDRVLSLLTPLLRRTQEWEDRHIYAYYFLPAETRDQIEKAFSLRFPEIIIRWTPPLLAQVLEERLRVASRGRFTSFRGIGRADLPVNPERYLVDHVDPLLPREVVYLAELVLAEHLKRIGPSGEIEQADLEGAILRYRKEKGHNGTSPSGA